MKKIIKIFGLHHSGTNVLSFLLKYNFNYHVCKDFLGWKHAYIYDLNYINRLAQQTNDSVCTILCVRSPYDWLWRFLNNSYEFFAKDLNTPVFCETNNAQEYYLNPVDMYNKKLENYKNFIEYNNNSMFVRHEDLITQQIETLTSIKNKFHLVNSYEQIVPFYKRINNMELIIPEQVNNISYISYKNMFSEEDIDFIESNLDKALLQFFNY